MDELTEDRKQALVEELHLYVKLGMGEQYLAGLPEHERVYLMEWATEFIQKALKTIVPAWEALVVWVSETILVLRPIFEKLADTLAGYYPRLMHRPYSVTPMPRWLRATVRVRPVWRLGRLSTDTG